ncbi:hypothetical protein TNCV_3245361 [Trichonephila clavipes]|nr:hypothetical protein TNCV_3245361 [Trichonephila clavipes]
MPQQNIGETCKQAEESHTLYCVVVTEIVGNFFVTPSQKCAKVSSGRGGRRNGLVICVSRRIFNIVEDPTCKGELKRPPVGVVVRRGGMLRCHPRHLTMIQNYEVRCQNPRVAEQWDV